MSVGSIIPSLNDTYNLGSSESVWANVWTNVLNILTLLTDSQIEDDITANASKLIEKGNLVNSHLHAAGNVTSGTFGSGNYTFQDNLTVSGVLTARGVNASFNQTLTDSLYYSEGNLTVAGNVSILEDLRVGASLFFVDFSTNRIGILMTPVSPLSLTGDFYMDGDFRFPDNDPIALKFIDHTNAVEYMRFVTSNGAELIRMAKLLDLNAGATITGGLNMEAGNVSRVGNIILEENVNHTITDNATCVTINRKLHICD